MSAPKTQCSDCGAEILQVTADITEGYCMPCAKRAKAAAEPKPDWMRMKSGEPVQHAPKLEADAIVFASFSPGFATDLTSWDTQILKSGKVVQEIDWWKPDGPKRRGTETRETQISSDSIDALRGVIDGLDVEGIDEITQQICVDDAELISLIVPSRKLQRAVSPYTYEFIDREHGLTARARSGLKSFRAAWDLIDSVSPYSTKEHWKRG